MAHQQLIKMNNWLKKNWMKNKNFQILEIGSFQPLSVTFTSKTIKDSGNLLT
jgi:hypothetical protein